MMPVLVRDLLDLPDHVSRGDFIQSLADSLRDPEGTVATYAVTGALAENFRQALRVVGAALSSNRSQPVFLHGSFGSGKSHFMAMLHLMLQGHSAPWRKPELHAVRAAYAPLEGKNLLQLHFHMLGAESFEGQVFKGYLDAVRQAHPDAALPGLFRDQEVFDNASSLRSTLGDEAFFQALNQGKQAVAGFGRLGAAARWTAERFEATLRSTDAKQRRDLFSDLVKTLLPAFAAQTDRFVAVDEGLGEMARHAAGLGYDAIVLHLDELILWLASRSADLAFVQRELTKLVKLKEARDERRDVPIVAYIARQRDLSELVGERATGAVQALVKETIAHHKSRFDIIELEDSNLRAIIPHRVVIPRSPGDRARLEDGFADMWRTAQTALDTLQAGTADQADFRQVYPFSPALIDALVALSDRLQRDRTAIRILVEMLVDHLPDLKLGEVVPTGDVFDLVASADDAVDGPSRAAFQRARDLYLHDVLPRLQAKHGATAPQRCQRLRDGHPLRLGCSGCAQVACRNDNRLVKTALLAALVPRARPFDGLTVKRLVHLNHGAVRAPVENMKVHLAANTLRDLARDVHALRIGDGSDPAVIVSLQSIDLKPIMSRADDQDTPQRRRTLLRKLLFEQLGVSGDNPVERHNVDFHNTRRTGQVRFGNVRLMRLEELRCPDNLQWQVVADYPFDDEGYTPHDDERRLEAIRERLRAATPTLVWLPTFFSRQVLSDLGDLARLEHVLDPDLLPSFLAHVPPDQHQRARTDLESLREMKRLDILEAMKKAYGVARPQPDDPHLDLNRAVREHVVSLHDALDPRTPRVGSMQDGLQDLGQQILDARYPHHPPFPVPPSPARLGRVCALLEPLAEQGGGMAPVDRAAREELQRIGEPLRLCRVHAQQVELLDLAFEAIEQQRVQENVDEPSAEQVFRWMDPQRLLGLQPTAAALVAWLWAARQRRVAQIGGQPISWPSNARLDPYTVFAKPDLPGESDFNQALARAVVFDVQQSGRALNARNLALLAGRLRAAAQSAQARAAQRTPALLQQRLKGFEVQDTSHRQATAAVLVQLLTALEARSDRLLAEGLAGASLQGTSLQALGRAYFQAGAVERALDGPEWTVLGLLRDKLDDDRIAHRARAVLDDVAQLLLDDELNAPLAARLRELADLAGELLKDPVQQPDEWRRTWSEGFDQLPGSEALDALDMLREELQRALAEAGEAPTRVRFSAALETRSATEEER